MTSVPDRPTAVRAVAGRHRRARLVTWRRAVAYLFAASLLWFAHPASGPLAPWGLVAGAAIALCGEALRVWGCGHLRKNRGVVTSGPYAHVRHPLYLGTLLLVAGFCVAAGSRLALFGLLPAGLAAFALYYAPKKERVESARLRRRFGAEFDRWRDAVPAYVPRLSRWPGASRERWSAALVARNSEVETALFVIGGLALLFVRARG